MELGAGTTESIVRAEAPSLLTIPAEADDATKRRQTPTERARVNPIVNLFLSDMIPSPEPNDTPALSGNQKRETRTCARTPELIDPAQIE